MWSEFSSKEFSSKEFQENGFQKATFETHATTHDPFKIFNSIYHHTIFILRLSAEELVDGVTVRLALLAWLPVVLEKTGTTRS